MRRPSQPIARQILSAARKADWEIEESKTGWKLTDPSGAITFWLHTSYSDQRAVRALRSRARRCGLVLKS